MTEDDGRILEGRNAVREAFLSGRGIDRLFVQEDLRDPVLQEILTMARDRGVPFRLVTADYLKKHSVTGRHQGVLAYAAAFAYSEVSEMLDEAREKGEAPFLVLLAGIEDPHNLGAIIRTAHQAGCHGVVIPKDRAAGLTPTVVRASAGALNYMKIARVANIGNTIDDLKKQGLWFVCADMDGQTLYDLDLRGPLGVVIGSEGKGVPRLVREKCDLIASIPMKGRIDSLNASVAAGVLLYEAVRQRLGK